MAFTVDEINAVSHEYFDKPITQQVYEKSPFFKTLESKKKIITDGGTKIQWPVRTAKLNNAKRTGPRERFDFTSKETRTGATAEWTYYESQTMIHWDERVKNGGKGQIVDLAKDRASELLEDIREELYTALYATSPTEGTDMNSLPLIVDSATSFGGIAVADAASWAGIEDGSTTTLLLYGAGSLSYMRNQATFGTDMPNLHVTTRDLVTKYESLLQPQQRYEDKNMANMGFENVTFHGKPVTSDVFCPSGYWFGLDMDSFEMRTNEDIDVSEWFDLKQVGYPKALGKVVTWVGNLKCSRRRTNFKFSALNYAL